MLPRVILYNATSVDGRMDWLDVDLGLYYGLAGHWEVDAVLAGSNTVVSGYPPEKLAEEDSQEVPGRDPADTRQILVVVDSRGRLRCWNLLRREPYWRDAMALCSHSTPQAYLDYLREREVDHIVTGKHTVDLQAALEELNARYGVRTIRVDSGGSLNGALLRAGLVHEVSLLILPSLVGGMSPHSIYHAPDLTSIDGTIPLKMIHMEEVQEGILWLRYQVVR